MTVSTQQLDVITTDVLVIGGGGAGFRAAIGAREKGANVILLSKGTLARCGASPMAGADLTCHGRGMRAAGFFGEPRDSEEKFLSDILHQGCFLNDQRLASLYVTSGPDRMIEMMEWGVRPNFTDERAVFAKGTSIMDALLHTARKTGVLLMGDTAVFELIRQEQDGRVTGAIGLNLRTGTLLVFRCKTVIMATGGWHKAYTPVTGSRELTGDGVAMAYRIGAAVSNMEFVTFACNVNLWPPIWSGSIFGYVSSLMFGNHLENSDGESVLGKYDPWMVAYANRTEWNKCFVSFASAREIRAGKGSPHGGLYYRLGDVPFEVFDARVNSQYPGWNFKGMDFSPMGEKMKSGEGVEVGPGAEYFEGGLVVDEHYATSVPGLYAAGECATSLFGANRVAAATMEMLTTGAIAGWSAGEEACRLAMPSLENDQVQTLIEKVLKPLSTMGGTNPCELRGQIQKQAQSKVGPIRNQHELQEMLAFLADLRAELPYVSAQSSGRVYNQSWLEVLELENMIQVLELSARAALERTESRGVHFREDHPFTDNESWLKEIVLQKGPSGMLVSTRKVTMDILPPPGGIVPYLDMLKRMMQGHSDIGGHH